MALSVRNTAFYVFLIDWNKVHVDVTSFPALTFDFRGKWNAATLNSDSMYKMFSVCHGDIMWSIC